MEHWAVLGLSWAGGLAVWWGAAQAGWGAGGGSCRKLERCLLPPGGPAGAGSAGPRGAGPGPALAAAPPLTPGTAGDCPQSGLRLVVRPEKTRA